MVQLLDFKTRRHGRETPLLRPSCRGTVFWFDYTIENQIDKETSHQ
jgi:hypothetical protein